MKSLIGKLFPSLLKTHVIHFYTSDKYIYDNFKIDHAKNFLPDWWKKLPTITKPEWNNGEYLQPTNMRACAGFTDLYANSLIMPMWSDLVVRIGEIGSGNFAFQYADGLSKADQHGENQRGEFAPDEKFCHLKLQAPWFIQAEKGLDFLLCDPMYNNNDTFGSISMTGVLNGHYQNALNANMLFRRENEVVEKYLNAGDPVIQIVPLTQKPVKIKHHLVTDEEIKNLIGSTFQRNFFSFAYQKNKKLKQNKRSKCPFGFKS